MNLCSKYNYLRRDAAVNVVSLHHARLWNGGEELFFFLVQQ
jgi:hypothetical protein